METILLQSHRLELAYQISISSENVLFTTFSRFVNKPSLSEMSNVWRAIQNYFKFDPKFNQIKKNTENSSMEKIITSVFTRSRPKNKVIAFVLTKPTSAMSILFSTLNIEYYKIAILKSLGRVSRKAQNLYHKLFSKA